MANEKRLIDAKALKERAIRVSTVKGLGNKEHCYIKAVGTHEIDKAPTVDAVEVVHGRWIFQRDAYICSICKEKAHSFEVGLSEHVFLSDYCPYCGAKMDKNENP